MKILWLSDLDDGVMWNQNFFYERRAFGRRHEVFPWGPGFPSYDPKMTAIDVSASYGPFDLVMLSEFFLYTTPLERVRELECKKAALLVDTYKNGVPARTKTWTSHGVSVVLHRYRTGIDAFRAANPGIRFVWHPWGVDPDVYRPYGDRPFDVAVLGNYSAHLYPERAWFRRELKKLGMSVKVLDLPHPTGFRHGHELRQAAGSVIGTDYARALASAKIAFASGGKPGYLVGKYFEIPACGTVLFGTEAEDLGSTGLRDAWSMVLVDQDDPCKPFAQLQALLADEQALAQIAENGRQLMLSRHTWDRRVDVVTSLLAG